MKSCEELAKIVVFPRCTCGHRFCFVCGASDEDACACEDEYGEDRERECTLCRMSHADCNCLETLDRTCPECGIPRVECTCGSEHTDPLCKQGCGRTSNGGCTCGLKRDDGDEHQDDRADRGQQ